MRVSTAGSLQDIGPESPIPNKLYFKIGEVSQLVGVRAHVLRYWEKEISSIRPSKSASNQRRYRRKDVEVFREVKRLLHEERYTLAGARKRLLNKDSDGDDDAEAIATSSEADLQIAVAAEVPPEDETPPATVHTEPRPQLPLGFAEADASATLERVREGLRELIELATESSD